MTVTDVRPGIREAARVLEDERFESALMELREKPELVETAKRNPESWLKNHGIEVPGDTTVTLGGTPRKVDTARAVDTEGCLRITIGSRLFKKLKITVSIGDCPDSGTTSPT